MYTLYPTPIPRLSHMLYPYAIFRIADFVTSTKSPFHAVPSKMYACEAQVLIRTIVSKIKSYRLMRKHPNR